MTAVIAELGVPSNQIATSDTLTQFEKITFDVQEITAHGDVLSPSLNRLKSPRRPPKHPWSRHSCYSVAGRPLVHIVGAEGATLYVILEGDSPDGRSAGRSGQRTGHP